MPLFRNSRNHSLCNNLLHNRLQTLLQILQTYIPYIEAKQGKIGKWTVNSSINTIRCRSYYVDYFYTLYSGTSSCVSDQPSLPADISINIENNSLASLLTGHFVIIIHVLLCNYFACWAAWFDCTIDSCWRHVSAWFRTAWRFLSRVTPPPPNRLEGEYQGFPIWRCTTTRLPFSYFCSCLGQKRSLSGDHVPVL